MFQSREKKNGKDTLSMLTQAARDNNMLEVTRLLDKRFTLIEVDKETGLSPLATLVSEGRNEVVMRLCSMEIEKYDNRNIYFNQIIHGALIGNNREILGLFRAKYKSEIGSRTIFNHLRFIEIQSSSPQESIVEHVSELPLKFALSCLC